MVFATSSVINQQEPEKVRRVCNAAAKYQGVALSNKPLSEPELLQSLIGTSFCSREHQIASWADIEAMFLQIAVPRWQPMFPMSLTRRPRATNESLRVYTTRFSGQNWLTCAYYVFHHVANDNAVNDESLVRTVQQNFYMNDFLISVRIPQEAIKIYQKVMNILIKGGFKLTKWVTSDNEVKSHMPEIDRSRKVVKIFEAEPQSSSTLGLNWNVDADSLIVSQGTRQEVPLKITPYRLSQQFSSLLGYVYPSPYECVFYSKAIEQKLGKHGTKNCQQTTQNCSLVGALSREK